jgi:voltage-gated potassium channel
MILRKNNNLRNKIHRIIFESDTRSGRLFDLVLLWLILLSIISVFLESVASFREKYIEAIHIIEWTFTILFTLEYALRIYSSKKLLSFIFSFYGLIDLITFIPHYLTIFFPGAQYLMVIRALRLLRIFQILKLSRFINENNVLKNALKASMHKITVFLASVITMVTIIGTMMYLIEGKESGFANILVAMYWAIVTITTVGHGEISPQSPLGQFLASILMLIGYGIIAVPTGIVTVAIAKATEESKRKCPECLSPIYPDKANFCSNCGKKLHSIA